MLIELSGSECDCVLALCGFLYIDRLITAIVGAELVLSDYLDGSIVHPSALLATGFV